MRTVKTNFKRSGKYFVVSMAHLSEAILVSAVYGLAYLYHGMNGRFGKRDFQMRARAVHLHEDLIGIIERVCQNAPPF